MHGLEESQTITSASLEFRYQNEQPKQSWVPQEHFFIFSFETLAIKPFLAMQSTGLEIRRDRWTTSRRNDTAWIGCACALLRQRRSSASPPRRCRAQFNLAGPDQLGRDVERQPAKQAKPHRGRKSNKNLKLTVVHPTARSR